MALKMSLDKILSLCVEIDAKVPCCHQPKELDIITEHIYTYNSIEGPIVELGSFKGGSTAKLSLVAAATNRMLFVFDSFEGLPRPTPEDRSHYKVDGIWLKDYQEGDYKATLEEAQHAVSEYGAIDSTAFIPGWFSDTLKDFNEDPAFVFMDVDLIESARTCLKFLYPRMKDGGRWFLHEATSRTFISGVFNRNWWHSNLGECPPIVYGAGYGHGKDAVNLAYFDK